MTESPLLTTLVSHDAALALELQPDVPLAVTRGDPRAAVLELYRDDVVQCGVWEVTPGEFAGENAGFGEHMYVLCGDATVSSEDGETVELGPGVSFVTRAGGAGAGTFASRVAREALLLHGTARSNAPSDALYVLPFAGWRTDRLCGARLPARWGTSASRR